MCDDDRKYRFSLVRGVLKFIPYGIGMLFLTYIGSMKASVSGHEPTGVGALLFFISLGGIICLGRGEPRPRKCDPQVKIPWLDKVEDDTSEESDCLECGAKIAVGSSKCKSCGWSYRSSC